MFHGTTAAVVPNKRHFAFVSEAAMNVAFALCQDTTLVVPNCSRKRGALVPRSECSEGTDFSPYIKPSK